MNGNNDFKWSVVLPALLAKANVFLNQNRRKVFFFFIIVCVYVFAALTYKVSPKIPEHAPDPDKYSHLYLQDFLSGYRDYQQDFDVEDISFGEKFLTFTVAIKFKTKSVLLVKKLAVDMVLGIKQEYPEMETISVKAIKSAVSGVVTIYGRAAYSKTTDAITWEYN